MARSATEMSWEPSWRFPATTKYYVSFCWYGTARLKWSNSKPFENFFYWIITTTIFLIMNFCSFTTHISQKFQISITRYTIHSILILALLSHPVRSFFVFLSKKNPTFPYSGELMLFSLPVIASHTIPRPGLPFLNKNKSLTSISRNMSTSCSSVHSIAAKSKIPLH